MRAVTHPFLLLQITVTWKEVFLLLLVNWRVWNTYTFVSCYIIWFSLTETSSPSAVTDRFLPFVDNNTLTGSIPSDICQLEMLLGPLLGALMSYELNLSTMYLSYSSLTSFGFLFCFKVTMRWRGVFLVVLTNWRICTLWVLVSCYIKCVLLTAIIQVMSLIHFSLVKENNALTGSIPTGIVELSNLVSLRLGKWAYWLVSPTLLQGLTLTCFLLLQVTICSEELFLPIWKEWQLWRF